MKKVYFLSLLCCISIAAFSQSTTVTINATGAAGSYKTGYIANPLAGATRNDGDMQVHWAALSPTGDKRGWAVFNVPSVVPPAATVTAVNLRFTISATANAANPTVGIFGYVGDLSTITTASTVFTDCNGSGAYTGISFCSTLWGGAVGTVNLTLNPTGIGFVNTNAASILSLGFQASSNAGQTYTITGETGTTATQPQLQITYNCTGVSGVAASASPNPVCVGSTLTLTGAGTGTTSYLWQGPGGFTSTLLSPTLTASATSAGVYTFTATNSGGCPTTVTSAAVVVNPLPAAISGVGSICLPGSTTLSDASGAGTWVSSTPAVATIVAGTGAMTAASQGTTTITYTATSTGCKVTTVETVNANPVAISGLSAICPLGTTTLSDASTGGTWSSSVTGVATIVSTTGALSAAGTGTTIVTYNNGCGTPATMIFTVYPLPANITGPGSVCPDGATITLNDATSGGTWSSSTTTVANVITSGPTTGLVTSALPGTTTITYTSPLTCITTTIVTVDPLPAPITGVLSECAGTLSTLSDVTPSGTWSSSNTPIATIGSSSGMLIGVSGGTTVITYATNCGYITAVDTVIASPSAIVGTDSVCIGGTTTYASIPAGGTWASSLTPVATVLSGSGIITGVTAGTSTITYTIPPGCFVTATVKVLSLPPAITGVMRLCPGTTTTLFDSRTGGSWSSGQSYVATVVGSTGVVTGVSADTANIIYTDRAGCSISATVTVNPLPDPIIGGFTTCATSFDTLYDATAGGTWVSGNTGVAIVGSSTGIVQTGSGGVAIISYKMPATGCYVTKSFTVHPLPLAPVTYDFATNSFFTDTFYVNYQWYNTVQNLIPGAIAYQTAALYNGYYWVVVTDTNGCVGTSSQAYYNIAMLGVTNQSSAAIHIYPNPTSGTVHIESGVRVRAVVSGIDGKTEMEQADAKELDMSALANGMYIISLYDNNGKELLVQKMIKQ